MKWYLRRMLYLQLPINDEGIHAKSNVQDNVNKIFNCGSNFG